MLVTKLENGAIDSAEVRRSRVATYFCPSNVGVRSIRNNEYRFIVDEDDFFGGTDIAGNIGSFWPFDRGCQGPLPPTDGVIVPLSTAPLNVDPFMFRSGLPLVRIKDGLSTTFLAFEKRQALEELEEGSQTPGNAVGWTAGLPGCDPRIVRGGDTLRQPVADWGPNLLRSPGSGTRLLDRAVGSSHPSGVVCGFCDGRALFVQSDIDVEVRRALSTRGDGERIDPATLPSPWH
jgi:hypothetical protein